MSDLCIPGYIQPWENVSLIHPSNVARPLKIMIDGPLGSSSYNNEFGRPCITGYFRTFLHQSDQKNQYYGYHKPIMIAGGIGSVIYQNIEKKSITPNSYIIVLGGPSMLIGIGTFDEYYS